MCVEIDRVATCRYVKYGCRLNPIVLNLKGEHARPRFDASIVDIARAALQALCGDRLRLLVLFGFRARGDAQKDSDFGLLIVLDGPVDTGREARRTSGVVGDAAT